MLLGRAQADDPDGIVVGAFGEHQHMHAGLDQADGDEAGFAMVEPVIVAFQCRISVETGRRSQGNAMLD